MSTAYEQGVEAYENGASYDKCPYSQATRTRDYYLWKGGWNDADIGLSKSAEAKLKEALL